MIDNSELTPKQLVIHDRLREDLRYFCKKALKIKTKSGKMEAFVWNKAQEYIHECLEAQLLETGKVRAVILKGRQQGCSTYVGARYYHRATWRGYLSVYILSHEADSTKVLFNKVKTYWENSPDIVRPEVKTDNTSEYEFKNGSTYKVGTAKTKDTGRSQTNQLFHGSEVAFYQYTSELTAGVLQTIADVEDTEIILESTANGVGNFLHKTCMDALAGIGDYILIFVPWYWQEEYRTKVPKGWEFTSEELEIKERYDLDDEQLFWRYIKITKLGERLFKQEYPFTVQEAFQASGETLIDANAVQAARKCNISDPTPPVIIGVDPARISDRTVITVRRGREILEIKKYGKMDTLQLVGILAELITRRGATKCFIDFALGVGSYDNLVALGYGDIVTLVNFGGKADDPREYLNKRVEMAFRFKEWLEGGNVNIPDDEEVEVDILSIPDFKLATGGQKKLLSKDDIKKELGKSPDIFDSIILTFAYLVASVASAAKNILRTQNTKRGSSLTTLRRQRGLAAQDESDSWNEPDPRISPRYSGYMRKRR